MQSDILNCQDADQMPTQPHHMFDNTAELENTSHIKTE